MIEGIFIPHVAMPEANNEIVSVTIFCTGNATVSRIINGEPNGMAETVFAHELSLGTKEEANGRGCT